MNNLGLYIHFLHLLIFAESGRASVVHLTFSGLLFVVLLVEDLQVWTIIFSALDAVQLKGLFYSFFFAFE